MSSLVDKVSPRSGYDPVLDPSLPSWKRDLILKRRALNRTIPRLNVLMPSHKTHLAVVDQQQQLEEEEEKGGGEEEDKKEGVCYSVASSSTIKSGHAPRNNRSYNHHNSHGLVEVGSDPSNNKCSNYNDDVVMRFASSSSSSQPVTTNGVKALSLSSSQSLTVASTTPVRCASSSSEQHHRYRALSTCATTMVEDNNTIARVWSDDEIGPSPPPPSATQFDVYFNDSSNNNNNSNMTIEDSSPSSTTTDELEYGPGIVNRLRSRFINLTLKRDDFLTSSSFGPVRRVASMEQLLDVVDVEPTMTVDSVRSSSPSKFIRNEGARTRERPSIMRYVSRWSSSSSARGGPTTEVIKRARSMETLTAIDRGPILHTSILGIRPMMMTRSVSYSRDEPLSPLAFVNENVVIIEHSKPSSGAKVSNPAEVSGKGPSLATLRVAQDLGRKIVLDEGEFPKPDTVRTYKRIFEPNGTLNRCLQQQLRQQQPQQVSPNENAKSHRVSQVPRVKPPPKPAGLKPSPKPALVRCAKGLSSMKPLQPPKPALMKMLAEDVANENIPASKEPNSNVNFVAGNKKVKVVDDKVVSNGISVPNEVAAAEHLSPPLIMNGNVDYVDGTLPEDVISKVDVVKSKSVIINQDDCADVAPKVVSNSDSNDVVGAKQVDVVDLGYVVSHLKPVSPPPPPPPPPPPKTVLQTDATALPTADDKPRVVSIQPKNEDKPVGHIRPFQKLEQQKNRTNELKSKSESAEVGHGTEESLASVTTTNFGFRKSGGSGSSPQRQDPVSQTFNFVGKDVQPHIANTMAPFSVRRPTLRNIDKVGSSKNKENVGPSSPQQQQQAPGFIIAGVDVDASWREFVDEDDELLLQDFGSSSDYLKSSNIVFLGSNVIVGRSALLKNRNKKLNISFDDSALSTYEYPSECSLLEDEDSPTQENGIDDHEGNINNSAFSGQGEDDEENGRSLNSLESPEASSLLHSDLVQSAPDTKSASTLKSTPAIGSTGGLASYTPMAVVGGGHTFELGVSRAPVAMPVTTKSSEEAEASVAHDEDIFLKPASDDQTSVWSNTETVDLLF